MTGASGFLGHAVVRRLTGTDVSVVPVSRREGRGILRVADYAETPVADVLIHLAEPALRSAAQAAGEVYEADAQARLETLLDKPYERVIYASSAAVYGDVADTPRTPHDPIDVSDAYTRVKRRGEVAVLGRPGGIVARLANLFGPGMSSENVISAILGQIPGSGPLVVRDSEPVRDFLWVDDAADALARMTTGIAAGVFNVGSSVGSSVGTVAKLALEIAGEKNRAVLATQAAARRSHLVLDITDTIDTWGWSPSTSLAEGLGRLLKPGNHAAT